MSTESLPTTTLAKASNAPAMTGAEAVVRTLELLGVTDVFGLPGGAILPVYDPLMDSKKLRHILVRHEQGAGHAAEGYAAASGKLGVCIATSGPGATNLVTPIMDAMMDSVPMLAITGQVNSHAIGTDAFQEADIVGITMPITKHSFLVTKAEDIPETTKPSYFYEGFVLYGAGTRSRTRDLLITSQLLYQLSYTGVWATIIAIGLVL